MEREIKILGIDRTALESTLHEKGARLIFRRRLRDMQFDFEDSRLMKQGKLMRLRVHDETHADLVYKGPRTDVAAIKERPEYGFTLQSEPEIVALQKILSELGLEVIGSQEKDRTSYGYGEVTVDIDQYPSIPVYAEIEGPTEEAIDEAITSLGLRGLERSTLSSEEIFKRFNPDGDFSNLFFP